MTRFRTFALLTALALPWVPTHPRKQAFFPPRPPRASALIMPTRPQTAFGVPLTPRLGVFFPTHPRVFAVTYPTEPRAIDFVIPDHPRLVA
jgi:hypothetical protein